ncbi:MAG: hypothetical protein KDE19_16645 [Caldilineaceae bacterium]|nr:hypothetical protein [Caldilineaceae bacterium]
MNHTTRTLILRADAILLAFFGLFGIVMDLLGYFAGMGAWGTLFWQNPLAVGVVEAHGLALIVALLLLRHATVRETMGWHLTAVSTHLLLGICNLLFWQVFITVNLLPLGVVATLYHFIFVFANGAVLFRRKLVWPIPQGAEQ